MVAHSVTTATRLLDIAPLLESDRRVQVTYTCAPSSVFSAGVRGFLDRLGAVVVPWEQAARTQFDLAVAASQGGLEQLHAPVLTVPHGVGFSKYPGVWPGRGPRVARVLGETDPWRLVYHGRVVAASIVVATVSQRERLARSCPEAGAIAVVAGDPCLDRLMGSLRLRPAYRRALGAGGRLVVAVSSTWGPGSLLEQHPDLLPKLLAELPHDRYQVAAIIHPNVWHWHGRRQVNAWLAEGVRRGLVIVPPEEGWRAVLAAADVLIGDHGSVTCYAAAARVPVTLASFPSEDVDPRSQVASLSTAAPRFHTTRSAAPQLDDAMKAWSRPLHERVHAQVTSAPGQAASMIRRVMYRFLELPEPAAPAMTATLPAFVPAKTPDQAGIRE